MSREASGIKARFLAICLQVPEALADTWSLPAAAFRSRDLRAFLERLRAFGPHCDEV